MALGAVAPRPPIKTAPRPGSGRIFRHIRDTLRMTPRDLAARLGTTNLVVEALERSDVAQLPAWPEVERIVGAYANVARIEAAPLLAELKPSFDAVRAPTEIPHAAAAAPSRAHPDAEPARTRALPAIVRRLMRPRLLAKFAVVAVALGLLQSPALDWAQQRLPESASRLARGAGDAVAMLLAGEHAGLRWIEVEDPRSRRSDKLPSAAR